MGRKPKKLTLYAFMNGYQVGTLDKNADGLLSFSYSNDWLASDRARPISLSLPLTDRIYKGELVENYFNNLLSDNDEIKNRIQKRFSAASSRAFDLLSHIGKDCVGALQLSLDEEPKSVNSIEGQILSEQEIERTLINYRNAPLGMAPDKEFRISIAGAQEKTGLLFQEGKWYLPIGTTPTTHIIKLPIGLIEHHQIDNRDILELMH